MIIGIMQPYLFPYIGCFQLISHCDVFVLHDDVQYISGGWINRNRILVNAKPAWITLPVRADSHSRAINQRCYVIGQGARVKILNKIKAAYHKAKEFEQTFSIIKQIMAYEETNIADLNAHAINTIATHFKIKTRIVRSSAIPGLDGLKGIHRVIAICKTLGASEYVNPIGGIDLYSPEPFAEAGIDLHFLRACPLPYSQFAPEFIPYLSIIDVMMHNNSEAIMNRLTEYCIVEPPTRTPCESTTENGF